MDLEQRVKVLEQEVAILKNQIQATLLDIQEQILVHQYPALRAEEMSDRPSAQVTAPHSAAPAADGDHSNGHRASGSAEPEPATAANLAAGTGPAEPPAQVMIAPHEWFARAADSLWSTLNSMMQWLQDSIQRSGTERTAQQVEIFAQKKLIPAEVRDALLEMIALYEEGEEPFSMVEEWPACDEEGDEKRHADDLLKGPRGASGKAGAGSHDERRNVVLRLIAGLKTYNAGLERQRG